jgi:hypothetical protein
MSIRGINLNQVIAIPQDKAVIADRNIRIHYPMPLHNPFGVTERVTRDETLVAYEAWLRYKLLNGDKLITSEMERIAGFILDNTGKPVGLIGQEGEVAVISKIILEALNQ